jgi:hypothetical protein
MPSLSGAMERMWHKAMGTATKWPIISRKRQLPRRGRECDEQRTKRLWRPLSYHDAGILGSHLSSAIRNGAFGDRKPDSATCRSPGFGGEERGRKGAREFTPADIENVSVVTQHVEAQERVRVIGSRDVQGKNRSGPQPDKALCLVRPTCKCVFSSHARYQRIRRARGWDRIEMDSRCLTIKRWI